MFNSYDIMQNFKKDVQFANLSDSINCEVNRTHGYKRIMGEVKRNNLKIQLVTMYGITIQFMQGNKILESFHIVDIIKDKNFENKVSDFLNVSFGEGREIYRSLMSIAIKYYK